MRRSPFRLVAFADDKPTEKADPAKDDKKQPACRHTPDGRRRAAKPADEKKPAEDKKPVEEKKSDAGKKTGDDKKPDAKSTTSDTCKEG